MYLNQTRSSIKWWDTYLRWEWKKTRRLYYLIIFDVFCRFRRYLSSLFLLYNIWFGIFHLVKTRTKNPCQVTKFMGQLDGRGKRACKSCILGSKPLPDSPVSAFQISPKLFQRSFSASKLIRFGTLMIVGRGDKNARIGTIYYVSLRRGPHHSNPRHAYTRDIQFILI